MMRKKPYRFTTSDDIILKSLKEAHEDWSWKQISTKMNQKYKITVDQKQCCSRWKSYLRMSASKFKPWSIEEQKKVLDLYEIEGNKFVEIAKKLEGRSRVKIASLLASILTSTIRKLQCQIFQIEGNKIRGKTLQKLVNYLLHNQSQFKGLCGRILKISKNQSMPSPHQSNQIYHQLLNIILDYRFALNISTNLSQPISKSYISLKWKQQEQNKVFQLFIEHKNRYSLISKEMILHFGYSVRWVPNKIRNKIRSLMYKVIRLVNQKRTQQLSTQIKQIEKTVENLLKCDNKNLITMKMYEVFVKGQNTSQFEFDLIANMFKQMRKCSEDEKQNNLQQNEQNWLKSLFNEEIFNQIDLSFDVK